MTRTIPAHGVGTPSGSKIIELRELLASRFPGAMASQDPAACIATGVDGLDLALGGRLTRGALTEIVGSLPSTGSGTLIHALVDAARSMGRRLALVDGGNSFSPDDLANGQLAALLWVRCAGVEQALWAADLLMRDGNLPLVVLDLVMCGEKQVRGIPSSTWHRLQRVAEGHETSAVVLTPVPILSGIRHSLRLTKCFALPTLDLLRDEVTVSLRMETMRVRSQPFATGTFDHAARVLSA